MCIHCMSEQKYFILHIFPLEMYMSESEQINGCPLQFSVAPSCRNRDFKYREITNTFGYTNNHALW